MPEVVDRTSELASLRGGLDRARAGQSAVVVARGEPGAGLTTLLDSLVASADDCRVLRGVASERERDLAFSGLHALVGGCTTEIASLDPGPRETLEGALAIAGGRVAADPFAVGTALLALVARLADDHPLLALVDQFHLLDESSATALLFVARRLSVDRVCLVFATDDDADTTGDAQFESIAVPPLARADAAVLTARQGLSNAAVIEAVLDAANGNPLAIREIAASLTPAERDGSQPLDWLLQPGPRLTRAIERRLAALPDATREALLVAAASEPADSALVARALTARGLPADALDAAEQIGVVDVRAGRVTFASPAVRAVVYHSVAAPERRRVHADLAAAITDVGLDDVRAWHLAASITTPDDAIAADLDRSAERAAERGGYAVAARVVRRAAELTQDPQRASARLGRAAELTFSAGQPDAALALLDQAAALAGADQAEILRRRGRILARGSSADDAYAALIAGAQALEVSDPIAAGLTLADAVIPCLRAGRPRAAVELAARARTLAGDTSETLLAEGLARTLAGEEGVELVRRSAATPPSSPLGRLYLGLALRLVGDLVAAREMIGAVVRELRASGAPGLLPYALARVAAAELEAGQWGKATQALDEAIALAGATGQDSDRGLALGTAAWLYAARGDTRRMEEAARAATRIAHELGRGSIQDHLASAAGLLALSHGRHEEAVTILEPVVRTAADAGWADVAPPHRLPDLIEALVRSGERGRADAHLGTFAAEAARSGRASARAAAARCRGLLADDPGYEDHFEQALALAEPPFERARTLLCFGERLRRARQRTRAREQVRAALDLFDTLGCEPFAERCREELRASGETARKRDSSTLDDLTASERQVAELVTSGMRNREVAAHLFVTEKTVEFHLGNTYKKLGVRSRTELVRALGEG